MDLFLVDDTPECPALPSGSLADELEPLWAWSGEADSLSTPLERARAWCCLGDAADALPDGGLPLMAWEKGSDQAWGRLTPFHGVVGSDRITAVPPAALDLTAEESQALFAAVEPLFSSEGWALEWCGPLDWAVQHASLDGVVCASLQRVVGDSVQRWQSRTPLASARQLRRLQNEAQMVLHQHAVNEQRQARGAMTVNSLWLSDTGAGAVPGAAVAEVQAAWNQHRVVGLGAQSLATDGTADAALQAWREAARAGASGTAGGAGSRTGIPRLVLCGQQYARAFAWSADRAARRQAEHDRWRRAGALRRWWWTLQGQVPPAEAPAGAAVQRGASAHGR